jgi:phospholipase/carboxylesterase
MASQLFQGIELLPDAGPAKQMFVLLHGVGASSSDLLPLARELRKIFPNAAYLLPDGFQPFDRNPPGNGDYRRQWFSISGMTDDTRPARVAAAMPALHDLVRLAQHRHRILQSDTALVGFSQGAIMALEFSIAHDGGAGRVLAFSGRFATLPDKAPELTTLHLLHGEDDHVIPVARAYDGYARLTELQGDATLDVASSVGHEMHPVLVERALNRLQTCIPLRSWQQALKGA